MIKYLIKMVFRALIYVVYNLKVYNFNKIVFLLLNSKKKLSMEIKNKKHLEKLFFIVYICQCFKQTARCDCFEPGNIILWRVEYGKVFSYSGITCKS